MEINKKTKKQNKYLFYCFTIFILFISPIILYGQIDLEEYFTGYFVTKLFINNPNYFFNDYIDFLGLGTDFFNGFSFILHPANFL